jgi:hypothetical protein
MSAQRFTFCEASRQQGSQKKEYTMNTRNIQTFLMVSAAFFAISAPMRSNAGSAGSLSNAVTRPAQVAPARIATQREAGAGQADGEEQNS